MNVTYRLRILQVCIIVNSSASETLLCIPITCRANLNADSGSIGMDGSLGVCNFNKLQVM